jgi:hypothetical protein
MTDLLELDTEPEQSVVDEIGSTFGRLTTSSGTDAVLVVTVTSSSLSLAFFCN